MIINEAFNTNHVRRYSDKNVKIRNLKDNKYYDIAEDWNDEWFIEHGILLPTYIESDIPTDTTQDDINE